MLPVLGEVVYEDDHSSLILDNVLVFIVQLLS